MNLCGMKGGRSIEFSARSGTDEGATGMGQDHDAHKDTPNFSLIVEPYNKTASSVETIGLVQ